ncbi:hypothetical protein ACLOJK_001897 [Asimina triloba]
MEKTSWPFIKYAVRRWDTNNKLSWDVYVMVVVGEGDEEKCGDDVNDESRLEFLKMDSGDYDSSEPHESVKAGSEKDTDAYNTATIIEIDQMMKKHTDNLLHALEGVSARLSQMESRTQRLESSVDELKTTIANNHGSIDGKLRQMENTLREV